MTEGFITIERAIELLQLEMHEVVELVSMERIEAFVDADMLKLRLRDVLRVKKELEEDATIPLSILPSELRSAPRRSDTAVLDRSFLARLSLKGSKSSRRYHLPGCRVGRQIAPCNARSFGSISEARAAGYEPCRLCCPPQ